MSHALPPDITIAFRERIVNGKEIASPFDKLRTRNDDYVIAILVITLLVIKLLGYLQSSIGSITVMHNVDYPAQRDIDKK